MGAFVLVLMAYYYRPLLLRKSTERLRRLPQRSVKVFTGAEDALRLAYLYTNNNNLKQQRTIGITRFMGLGGLGLSTWVSPHRDGGSQFRANQQQWYFYRMRDSLILSSQQFSFCLLSGRTLFYPFSPMQTSVPHGCCSTIPVAHCLQ